MGFSCKFSLKPYLHFHVYRKTPYLMGKSMVSCRFSQQNQSIELYPVFVPLPCLSCRMLSLRPRARGPFQGGFQGEGFGRQNGFKMLEIPNKTIQNLQTLRVGWYISNIFPIFSNIFWLFPYMFHHFPYIFHTCSNIFWLFPYMFHTFSIFLS